MMSAESSFIYCEALVKRHDPDRYFAALFAPEGRRRHLFALAALYYELAHAAQAARESMLADIRLAWWRETIEGARAGMPRNHDVAKALAETLTVVDLPAEPFERLIAARALDTGNKPFAGLAEVEDHADATAGSLMRMSARVLGASADDAARAAGIAYGLAGRSGPRFVNVQRQLADRARLHLSAARKMAIPRAALAAFLPAALVPLYLKRENPPLWRKQIALFSAAARGRL
jgi:15-cis-phytoene synthase